MRLDVRALFVAALVAALMCLVLRRRYRLFQVRLLQTNRFEARRVAKRLYLQRSVFVGASLILALAFFALWLASR